jgi:hypothetical protein
MDIKDLHVNFANSLTVTGSPNVLIFSFGTKLNEETPINHHTSVAIPLEVAEWLHSELSKVFSAKR